MFRRKDEAYDPNDLLSEVMSDPSDDQTIDTGSNDKPAAAAAKSPAAPVAKPKPAPMPTAAAPSNPAVPSAPAANQNTATPVSAAPTTPAAKPMAASAFRPQPAPAARSMAPAAPAPAPTPAAPSPVNAAVNSSKRVLTVGHDIHMKGEISTCDRLLIEGSVDAILKDVHTVEITQSGSFKGTAEIEDAEISGTFEGDLIVNGRLTIYASGVVSGNVSYGEIQIERGGKLTGTIKTADEMKSQQNKPLKKAA